MNKITSRELVKNKIKKCGILREVFYCINRNVTVMNSYEVTFKSQNFSDKNIFKQCQIVGNNCPCLVTQAEVRFH